MSTKSILMYGLSTCTHCANAKAIIESMNHPFDVIYVDRLAGDDRNKRMNEVRKHNPQLTFPTIIINQIVVVGDDEEAIKKALTSL
ncbi:glutaredoxin family protein [Desulfovibrio inopinatus]|uniref:glutaredoxin family protein n=1 Tax=Desulfovibrio inopinatus TaxID=102109 RepID=UPI0004273EAF|nr:glutaredoxin [Desulfovibrio inopinatus]